MLCGVVKCFLFGISFRTAAYHFWKIRVIQRRIGRCSTASAVWHWLTAVEAQAGLVDADVLTVRRWWLEERRLVLVCQLVKTVLVCQSVGSSSQTKDL